MARPNTRGGPKAQARRGTTGGVHGAKRECPKPKKKKREEGRPMKRMEDSAREAERRRNDGGGAPRSPDASTVKALPLRLQLSSSLRMVISLPISLPLNLSLSLAIYLHRGAPAPPLFQCKLQVGFSLPNSERPRRRQVRQWRLRFRRRACL